MSDEDKSVNTDDKSGKKNNDDKSVNTDDKSGEKMIPKSRFDEVNERRKSVEKELQEIADELKSDVPERFQEMIPDLPPSALIKWLRKASEKGLFTTPSKEEDGPDSKRPNKQKSTNYEGMSSVEKIRAGYKK